MRGITSRVVIVSYSMNIASYHVGGPIMRYIDHSGLAVADNIDIQQFSNDCGFLFPLLLPYHISMFNIFMGPMCPGP